MKVQLKPQSGVSYSFDPTSVFVDQAPEHWPVSYTEHFEMRSDIVRALFDSVFKLRSTEESYWADVLEICLPSVTVPVLRALYYKTVLDRFDEQNISITPPEEYYFVHALKQGDLGAFLAPTLKNQFKLNEEKLNSLKCLKDIVNKRKIRRSFVKPAALFLNTPIVSFWSKELEHFATQETACYVPHSFWFPTSLPDLDDQKIPIVDRVALEISEALSKRYPAAQKAFIQNFIKDLISYFMVHVNYLIKKASSKPIPKTYWSGSGGSIFMRIMRYLVTQNGGRVMGFAHGGSLYFLDSPYLNLYEHYLCDRYVYFSDTVPCKPRYPDFIEKSNAAYHPSLESFSLDLKSIQCDRNNSMAYDVLIVPFEFLSDDNRFMFRPADLIKAQLLKEVVYHLKSWGLNVAVKPHPEFKNETILKFYETLDAEVLWNSFEAALANSQKVLFFYPYTTSLQDTYRAKKEIVLLDSALDEWCLDFENTYGSRIKRVNAPFSNENFFAPHWDNLKKALV